MALGPPRRSGHPSWTAVRCGLLPDRECRQLSGGSSASACSKVRRWIGEQNCAHDGVVALLAIAFNAAAIALTVVLSAPSRPWRCARNAGSLYDSHVVPDASCQTKVLSGRSMPNG